MKTITTVEAGDFGQVTPSEATELCIHHLRLAFSMYLSSEGDDPISNMENLQAELHRQVTDRGAGDWAVSAMFAFIEAAVKGDEESRERD